MQVRHTQVLINSQDFATGQGSENVVRRLLDRVGDVAEAVGSVSAQPAKTISSWMSDQIAPKYWTPNSKILVRAVGRHL